VWWGHRGALRIDLSVFFPVIGALLIIVAAGTLAYGTQGHRPARSCWLQVVAWIAYGCRWHGSTCASRP
jgi:hypothetical protein